MKNINNKKSINNDIRSYTSLDRSLKNYQKRQERNEIIVCVVKALFFAAFMIMAIDFFGFAAWIISGQNPGDGLYIGSITANIIKTFIL